jgi:Tfp pilus assembly protein PilV
MIGNRGMEQSMSAPGGKRERGISLIEVLIAMTVTSIALVAFVQTVKPTISGNKANRKYIDITAALSEVLDSAMTQPVSTLDLMGGTVVKSRQKVDVKVLVAAYSQAQADAMMAGLDVSRMRKVTVKAVVDTTRTLSATVSNYQESATGRCYP